MAAIKYRLISLCVLYTLTGAYLAYADEFSATNFKLLDPVLFSGEYATSTDYSLFSVLSQNAIGTSTASSFTVFGGFLHFPFVTTPVVSATTGDSAVDLSWTAASAGTGWTVGGYTIGQSTTSGGPYTFTSVGNVLASSRAGLSNGTPYYFVIQVTDALGYVIATSSQISVTPAASATPPSGSGEGGSGGGGGARGGGGDVLKSVTGVTISGRAYPLSTVTLLKDGQRVLTTVAGPDAYFNATLTDLSPGSYVFTVFGEDGTGARSTFFSFSISVARGVATSIGGIFIAPTIKVDKSDVRKGDTITIFGQSVPDAEVLIAVHSENEFFVKIPSDQAGAYLYRLDTSPLAFGLHIAKSKSALSSGPVSDFSHAVQFRVGSKNIATELKRPPLKGDISGDGRVNIIDFSIAAYWYTRLSPPSTVDFNGDGAVSLIDFSIMAFYWTG